MLGINNTFTVITTPEELEIYSLILSIYSKDVEKESPVNFLLPDLIDCYIIITIKEGGIWKYSPVCKATENIKDEINKSIKENYQQITIKEILLL